MAQVTYPFAVKANGVFYGPGNAITVANPALHIAQGATEITPAVVNTPKQPDPPTAKGSKRKTK